MNRYEPSNLRALFGIAAVAMTALTITASVVVPASLTPMGHEGTTLAKLASPATEVAISPARIEVVGYRETSVAVSPRDPAAKQKPRS